jgi:hypothetical protein
MEYSRQQQPKWWSQEMARYLRAKKNAELQIAGTLGRQV